MKKKEYIPVVRNECNDGSFIEFGYIKNATYNNTIYKRVYSEHKGEFSEHYDEMREDEALMTISGLADAIKVLATP